MSLNKMTALETMKMVYKDIGYREGPNNSNKYTRKYGVDNVYWCQGFTRYHLDNAGVGGPATFYTPTAANWYKARNRLFKSPKVGDQFFVYSTSSNGNGVYRRTRAAYPLASGNGVVAYGRPAYATEKSQPRKATKKPSVKKLQKSVRANVDGIWGPRTDSNLLLVRKVALVHGNVGALKAKDIQRLQWIINTPQDGIWGSKSKSSFTKCVAKIQDALNVAPDGIWGPITDNKFINFRKEKKRD
jgi:hypothetical protein